MRNAGLLGVPAQGIGFKAVELADPTGNIELPNGLAPGIRLDVQDRRSRPGVKPFDFKLGAVAPDEPDHRHADGIEPVRRTRGESPNERYIRAALGVDFHGRLAAGFIKPEKDDYVGKALYPVQRTDIAFVDYNRVPTDSAYSAGL